MARATAALVVAMGGLVVLAPAAPAAAATLTVATPAAGATVPWSFTASGLAAGDVAGVHVAVLRLADNRWSDFAGGFVTVPVGHAAAVAPDGTWTLPLVLGGGDYAIVARSRAADGTPGPDVAAAFHVDAPPVLLTLLLGRAMLGQSYRCQLVDGTITLWDVAEALKARGLSAVGVVVPDRTAETGARCENGNLYPSWEDLGRLRDEYGWTFVSNGQARLDLPRLTRPQQIVESCGSLDAFAAHGHLRAWGLFGPNSNHVTDAIATEVLNRCFGFTRVYAGGVTRQAGLAPPYYERVSVAGGGRGAYDPPAQLLGRYGATRPGDWLSIGSYKFVDGRRFGLGGAEWDCTAADPAQHWTTDDEIYCWQDYLAVLDHLPAHEVVDPATVAERWRRVPVVQVDGFAVRPAAVASGTPAVTVTFTPYESGSWWLTVGQPCLGATTRAAGAAHRAGAAVTTRLAAAVLPTGSAHLELCVADAFGRVGVTAVDVPVAR